MAAARGTSLTWQGSSSAAGSRQSESSETCPTSAELWWVTKVVLCRRSVILMRIWVKKSVFTSFVLIVWIIVIPIISSDMSCLTACSHPFLLLHTTEHWFRPLQLHLRPKARYSSFIIFGASARCICASRVHFNLVILRPETGRS